MPFAAGGASVAVKPRTVEPVNKVKILPALGSVTAQDVSYKDT
jgi:hypothetical protein